MDAGDPDYPGFCRVILQRHAMEMTDLSPAEQRRLMEKVFSVEALVRKTLHPDKINLASLGNLVPHVHWHIIPRFATDAHFPAPIWTVPHRAAVAVDPAHVAELHRQIAALDEGGYDFSFQNRSLS